MYMYISNYGTTIILQLTTGICLIALGHYYGLKGTFRHFDTEFLVNKYTDSLFSTL